MSNKISTSLTHSDQGSLKIFLEIVFFLSVTSLVTWDLDCLIDLTSGEFSKIRIFRETETVKLLIVTRGGGSHYSLRVLFF